MALPVLGLTGAALVGAGAWWRHFKRSYPRFHLDFRDPGEGSAVAVLTHRLFEPSSSSPTMGASTLPKTSVRFQVFFPVKKRKRENDQSQGHSGGRKEASKDLLYRDARLLEDWGSEALRSSLNEESYMGESLLGRLIDKALEPLKDAPEDDDPSKSGVSILLRKKAKAVLRSSFGGLLRASLEAKPHPCIPVTDASATSFWSEYEFDLPKNGGTAPVVLFSHGLFGSLAVYTSVCADIAAAGFVVVSLEHEDGSGFSEKVVVEEGEKKSRTLVLERIPYRSVAGRPGFVYGNEMVSEFRKPFHDQRKRELEAVFAGLRRRQEEAVELAAARPGGVDSAGAESPSLPKLRRIDVLRQLLPAVDLDRVFLCGHSFGAASMTSVASQWMQVPAEKKGSKSSEFSRQTLRGVLLMDNWALSLEQEAVVEAIRRAGPPCPLFNLNSQGWEVSAGEFRYSEAVIEAWESAKLGEQACHELFWDLGGAYSTKCGASAEESTAADGGSEPTSISSAGPLSAQDGEKGAYLCRRRDILQGSLGTDLSAERVPRGSKERAAAGAGAGPEPSSTQPPDVRPPKSSQSRTPDGADPKRIHSLWSRGAKHQLASDLPFWLPQPLARSTGIFSYGRGVDLVRSRMATQDALVSVLGAWMESAGSPASDAEGDNLSAARALDKATQDAVEGALARHPCILARSF